MSLKELRVAQQRQTWDGALNWIRGAGAVFGASATGLSFLVTHGVIAASFDALVAPLAIIGGALALSAFAVGAILAVPGLPSSAPAVIRVEGGDL